MSSSKKEASKNTVSLELTLKYADVKKMVMTCIEAQEPIMIWGAPGIGKSDMMFEIGRETKREIIDIRLSQFENIDIRGIPYREGTKVHWSMGAQFPDDEDSTAIIFLDELNAADPSTQKAAYQFILNRQIGEYILPKGVAVVAAGNREQDKGGTYSMPKPLENRFVHVEMTPNFQQWLEWALAKGVGPSIVGFLQKNPENLYDVKPNQRAFATPRSWAKADKLTNIPNISDEMMTNLMSGCVGYPMTMQYMAYREIADKLPDPMDILIGKVTKVKVDDMSLSYVITTNCLYKLRELAKDEDCLVGGSKKPSKKWDEYSGNFFKFMNKNEDEIGVEFIAMAISTGMQTYKLPLSKETPGLDDFIGKHATIINTAF
jgi:ATPase family associated with various cellular activities (AAA)